MVGLVDVDRTSLMDNWQDGGANVCPHRKKLGVPGTRLSPAYRTHTRSNPTRPARHNRSRHLGQKRRQSDPPRLQFSIQLVLSLTNGNGDDRDATGNDSEPAQLPRSARLERMHTGRHDPGSTELQLPAEAR